MAPIPLVLMVFAFVCFLIAALPMGGPYWNRLVAAGLACWSFVIILGYAGVLGKG